MCKRLIGLLVVVISIFTFLSVSAEAEESRDYQVDALTQLVAKIEGFYLHPNAVDFLNHFYTEASIRQLREAFSYAQELKISDWESELDEATMTEIYQLLHSAIVNLRPLTVRRGEATSWGQDLNFRAQPAVETQVLYWLPYGTDFEIIEEVWGGSVTDEAGVTNYLWFRIRHDHQAGYVHSRYVRALPVSEYRIQLIADIVREELRIQSKIEGWSVEYAPNTRSQLQIVLNQANRLKVENWQFQFNYESLNNLLHLLNTDHLDLMLRSRYDLINRIYQLKDEIEQNIAGTGDRNREDYTVESWDQMANRLEEVQAVLIDGWEYDFSEEELQRNYRSLRLALDQLEEVPVEIEEVAREVSVYQVRIRQLFIGFVVLIGILALVGIVKLIRRLIE